MIKGTLKMTLDKNSIQEILAKYIKDEYGVEVAPAKIAFTCTQERSYLPHDVTKVEIDMDMPAMKKLVPSTKDVVRAVSHGSIEL